MDCPTCKAPCLMTQRLADQMGCDVTVRSVMSAELAEARARVAELERAGRIAA